MLHGVGITCFTASYFIVFCLELIQRKTRKAFSHFLIFVISFLGWIAHTAYIGHHFFLQNDHLVTGVSGWFFVLGWILMLTCILLQIFYPKTSWNLFLLPLVFLTIAAGAGTKNAVFPEKTTALFVRAFHGGSLMLTVLAMFIGFIAGLMYFLQLYQLKQRKISVRIFLPSLEWLQQVNRLMIRFSVLFLGLGILSGVYISHVVRLTGDPVSAFSDPMILGALILFFVLASALLFSSTSFFSDGRRVALLTVVGFLFLVIVLLAGLFCSQAHWYLMSAPVIPADSPVVSGKPETGSIPTSEPAAEQRGRTDDSLNPGIDSQSEGRP